MSLEGVTRNLSISDLLRLLNEKLDLECIRSRETLLRPMVSAASLESEVSTRLDRPSSPQLRTWQWNLTVDPSD